MATPLSSWAFELRNAFVCQGDAQLGFEEFHSFLYIRPDLVGKKQN